MQINNVNSQQNFGGLSQSATKLLKGYVSRASEEEAKILKETAKQINKSHYNFYDVYFAFTKNGDTYTSMLKGKPCVRELNPVSANIIVSDIQTVTGSKEPISTVINALKNILYQIQSEIKYLHK